jgi:hypothetical protein
VKVLTKKIEREFFNKLIKRSNSWIQQRNSKKIMIP